MMIFKRLDSDDESFKDFFETLSKKYTINEDFQFKDMEHFETFMSEVIFNLAELHGIFSAVTR